jgi:ATP-dependent Zn protease
MSGAGRARTQGRSDWARLARAAIHEAGHACLAVYLGRRELLNSMALAPGGGWTELDGEEDLEDLSVDLIFDRIAITLGGLAAESGLIGSPTVQSGADVADATRLAAYLARRGLLPAGPVADLEVLRAGVGAAPSEYAMRAVLRVVGAAKDEAAQAVVANVESVRDLALQLLIVPNRRLEGQELRDAVAVSGFEPKDRHPSDDDPLEVLRHVGRDFEFAWEEFDALMRAGPPPNAGG